MAYASAEKGGSDIFVMKLSGEGSLVWNTFLGTSTGSGGDAGEGLAVDASHNVYITGYSAGTWGSPIHAFTGAVNNIVALKLNGSGSLQWNTFWGLGAVGWGIAVDDTGNAYVAGYSLTSFNGPTGQPPLHAFTQYQDILVFKLNTDGAYQWHTFYGSAFDESARDIALDRSGGLYVTGSSRTWGSPLHANGGAEDIFVRDRLLGLTQRVSVSSAGLQSDGSSWRSCISADGRFVVFESLASNLVDGDTNGVSDVFRARIGP